MKVGPKGQVVIPKIFRESLRMGPGSEVFISEEEGRLVVEKPQMDPIAVFRAIAAKGKNVKIDPDKSYDEMMEERWKKWKNRHT